MLGNSTSDMLQIENVKTAYLDLQVYRSGLPSDGSIHNKFEDLLKKMETEMKSNNTRISNN